MSLPPLASPSAPSCWSSFRPGTSVDVELVCGPQQDGDRLSSMSSELAAAVSPSENSRLGMEKEAESEDSCWSSEAPAVTTDEFSFSSRSKPAGTHQRANSCRPSSQLPNDEVLLAEKIKSRSWSRSDLLPASPPPSVLPLSRTDRDSSSVVARVMVPFSEDSDDDSGGVGVASSSSSSTAVAGKRLLAALLLGTTAPVFVVGRISSLFSAGKDVSSPSGSVGAELGDAIVGSSNNNRN